MAAGCQFSQEKAVAQSWCAAKHGESMFLSKAFQFDMCARKNTIEFRKTKKNELYASKTQLNEEYSEMCSGVQPSRERSTARIRTVKFGLKHKKNLKTFHLSILHD